MNNEERPKDELTSEVERLRLRVSELEASKAKSEEADRALRESAAMVTEHIRDITERKQVEDAIQQSEKRFRELFDSVTDLIYTQDLEGRFLTANRAMTDIFAYDPGEFIGRRAADFMKPELRPFFDSEYLESLKQHGHYEGISSYFTKYGRRIYLDYRSTLVRPEDGEPYISGISRDVTERVAADRALREREERIRAIFQASPHPMVVYDTEGNAQFLNPAFTEVFGWSLDELRGKRIPFVPEEQRQKTVETIRELYESGAPVTLETRRSTRDGRILDILISAALIRGAGGNPAGMVVNLMDLTEKKKMEAALLQAQKMEAIGALAGGVAHDFNNLLMGVLGNISLMLLEVDSHHLNYDKLKSIEKYVQQGADLTKQLLSLGRGGKYEAKPTDLNALIENENRMFSRTRKEVRIRESYEEALWIVQVDRGQMAQVLLNLYINASQAMPGGGELHIQTENVTLNKDDVKPFGLASGRYVKISVTDTGVGMDEATRQRIFDPFFTTKEVRGTGLGLASVYGIVKNHGGFINVYSEKGHGATFNIYLPAIAVESLAQRAERKEAVEILRGDATVLFVDDEEMIIEIGKAFLEKLGYDVLIAQTGREAIETYEKNKERIDIVILDMIMPDMGGGGVYDRLKEVNDNIKVLLSSGYNINGEATEILNRGCNGFIQKPFNMKQLSQKLREILNNT